MRTRRLAAFCVLGGTTACGPTAETWLFDGPRLLRPGFSSLHGRRCDCDRQGVGRTFPVRSGRRGGDGCRLFAEQVRQSPPCVGGPPAESARNERPEGRRTGLGRPASGSRQLRGRTAPTCSPPTCPILNERPDSSAGTSAPRHGLPRATSGRGGSEAWGSTLESRQLSSAAPPKAADRSLPSLNSSSSSRATTDFLAFASVA